MKVVIETFVTLFFLTMFVFVASQLISMQIQVESANQYHVDIVKQIENSHFSDIVLEKCKEEAKQNNYELTIFVVENEELQCLDCNYTWPLAQDVLQCPLCKGKNVIVNERQLEGRVTMAYQVEAPLLGIKKEGKLVSNAR